MPPAELGDAGSEEQPSSSARQTKDFVFMISD
jgi:hypothetical protein